jgi:hypothetical protein
MKADDIEQMILSRSPPDLFRAEEISQEGWVLPHYDRLSIANLPSTLAKLLGSDLPGAQPPLPRELWVDWVPGLRRVVLVLLDALGYRLLQDMWAAGQGQILADLAQTGRLVPLTSVFPSTTDAAMVTLRTGLPPATHGWLAYEMYLREMGIAANAILLSPVWTRQGDLLLDWGLDPNTLVTVPTLAEHLTAQGVTTGAVLSAHLKRSGFTQMIYRGVPKIHGHLQASDFWVQLRHVLAETRGQTALITAYWNGMDTLAHAYGPNTDQWQAEFRSVSHLLDREFLTYLPGADREGTLLLITADHGQIYVPPEGILTANEDPELRQHLMVPVMGESRAAFVYPRPGRTTIVKEYLESEFPGWFAVLDSGQALEAGLMGRPVADETYARAGELLVLPRGDHALQRSKSQVPLLGRHGGLTPQEMLVPLLGVRLEALN